MRLDHLLSKELYLTKSALRLVFLWKLAAVGCIFWVDARWPQVAVFNAKYFRVCRCAVGCLGRHRLLPCASTWWLVCGVGGLFFLWALVACRPRLVWLVGFLVVLCENWIVDASILIFL